MKIGRLNIKSWNLGFLLSLAAAGALILAGCPSIFDPPAKGGGFGRVSVSFGLDTERTIRPDTSLIGDFVTANFANQEFKAYADPDFKKEVNVEKDGNYLVLPFGTYWLKVWIYDVVDGEKVLIATGQTPNSFTLKLDTQMLTVNINLTPAGPGGSKGTFKYNFSWASSLTGEFVVALEKLNGANLEPYPWPASTPTSAAAGYTSANNGAGWELDPGSYMFTFQFYKDAGAGYWGVTEAIHIESRMVTQYPPTEIKDDGTMLVEIDEANADAIFKNGLASWVSIPGLLAKTPLDFNGKAVTLYFVGERLVDSTGTPVTTFPLTDKGGWNVVTSVENPTPLAPANLRSAINTFQYKFRSTTNVYTVTLQPVAEYTVRKFKPRSSVTSSTADATFAGLISTGTFSNSVDNMISTAKHLGPVGSTPLEITRAGNADLVIDSAVIPDTDYASNKYTITNPESRAYTIDIHHQLSDQITRAEQTIPADFTKATGGWINTAYLSVVKDAIKDPTSTATSEYYDLYYVHDKLPGAPLPGTSAKFPVTLGDGWENIGNWVVDGVNANNTSVVFMTTAGTPSPKTVIIRLNPVAEFTLNYDEDARKGGAGYALRQITFKNAVDGTATLAAAGIAGTDISLPLNPSTASGGATVADTSKILMFKVNVPASDQASAQVMITGTLLTGKVGTSTLSSDKFVYGTEYYVLDSSMITSRSFKLTGWASDSEQRKRERAVLSTATNLANWVQSTEQPLLPTAVKYIANTGSDQASRIFYIGTQVPSTGTAGSGTGSLGIPRKYVGLDDPRFRFNTGSSNSVWEIFFTPEGSSEGDAPLYTINLTPVAEVSLAFQSTMSPQDRSTYKLMQITGTDGEWNGAIPTGTMSISGTAPSFGIVSTGTGGVRVDSFGQITVQKDGDASSVFDYPGSSGTFNAVVFGESAKYTVTVYPTVDEQRARANTFIRTANFRTGGLVGGATDTFLAVNPVVYRDTSFVDDPKSIFVYYYGSQASLTAAATGTTGVFLPSQWTFTTTDTVPKKNYGVTFKAVGEASASALTDVTNVILRQVAQFRAMPGKTGFVLGENISFVPSSGSQASISRSPTADPRARIDIPEGGTSNVTISSVANGLTVYDGGEGSSKLGDSVLANWVYSIGSSGPSGHTGITTMASKEYLVVYYPNEDDQKDARVTEAKTGIKSWITDNRLKDFSVASVQPNFNDTTKKQVLYYIQGNSTGSFSSVISGTSSPWSLKTGSNWDLSNAADFTITPTVKDVVIQNPLDGIINSDGTKRYAEFTVSMTPIARYTVEKANAAEGNVVIVTSETTTQPPVTGQWDKPLPGVDANGWGFLPLGLTTISPTSGGSYIKVYNVTNPDLAQQPDVLTPNSVLDAKSLLYRIIIATKGE